MTEAVQSRYDFSATEFEWAVQARSWAAGDQACTPSCLPRLPGRPGDQSPEPVLSLYREEERHASLIRPASLDLLRTSGSFCGQPIAAEPAAGDARGRSAGSGPDDLGDPGRRPALVRVPAPRGRPASSTVCSSRSWAGLSVNRSAPAGRIAGIGNSRGIVLDPGRGCPHQHKGTI